MFRSVVRAVPTHLQWLRLLCLGLLTIGCLGTGFLGIGAGQQAVAQENPVVAPEELEAIAAAKGNAAPAADQTTGLSKGINILDLIILGGPLMIPIGLMSVLVVMLVVERAIGLRTGNVAPRRFMRELEAMARKPDSFDPHVAWLTCGHYPSAAGRVVQAMLQRLGRPVADVEQAAADAAQREADRLSGPIRWLTLAAALTPLLGLFGTVWGMVMCFHNLTEMPVGQNKSVALAEGIYTALVTTVGGLAVAIPATFFAYWFEGRLLRLVRRVEELAFRIAPSFERFVGRMRLDADGHLTSLSPAPVASSVPPSVKAPPVHTTSHAATVRSN